MTDHFAGAMKNIFMALILPLFLGLAVSPVFAQNSVQCATNCSTSASTGCTNHQDISQFVS